MHDARVEGELKGDRDRIGNPERAQARRPARRLRWSGRCMTSTSRCRKAKQSIIATKRTIAIFTIVQRRSSRCSRKGFEVSLSGGSRKAKMLRSFIR